MQNRIVPFSLRLSIVISVVLILFTCSLNAQEKKPLEREGYFLPRNHYITDDINGNRVSIPNFLNEGKGVLVELCGIWSVNGQAIHENGMLKELYTKYGPTGSNEMEVIWVNTDSTSIDEIKGFSWWGGWFRLDRRRYYPLPYPKYEQV